MLYKIFHVSSLYRDLERNLAGIWEAATEFPDKKIYALIGGFHLFARKEAEVRLLAKRIRETGIQKVYTGHCTGEKAYRALREELATAVEQLYTGLVIEL